MSIFVCDNCDHIENTASSRYWSRNVNSGIIEPTRGKALCSECDPGIGRWHGRFDRRKYDPATDKPINR